MQQIQLLDLFKQLWIWSRESYFQHKGLHGNALLANESNLAKPEEISHTEPIITKPDLCTKDSSTQANRHLLDTRLTLQEFISCAYEKGEGRKNYG